MKKSLILLTVGVSLLVGCESAATREKIAQQQHTINDLESRIQKMEGQLDEVQGQMIQMQKSFSGLKQDVEKFARPSYIEGGVQENSN